MANIWNPEGGEGEGGGGGEGDGPLFSLGPLMIGS